MKYTNTAKLIRDKREKVKMSQSDLSKKLKKTSSQFISNFERGFSPLPIKKLKEIARVLKIDKMILKKQLMSDFKNHLNDSLK